VRSLALALVLGACGPKTQGASQTPSDPTVPKVSPTSIAEVDPPRAAPSTPASRQSPKEKLTVAEARRYMVTLINADRASIGLGPVELDEGAPTRAGQAHAEDMAKNGYLGHWGTDGSVPEQRLTEAGGADMVLENASCFVDEQPRRLDPSPVIDPKNVEAAESMFFHEAPPHDGHRKNISKPFHKKVGIGVAQPVATQTEVPVPCFSQEFVDPYGTYGAVPRKMKPGDTLHVEGSMSRPARFAGVGLARVDAPKPLAVDELNRRRSYPIPQPYQVYWPPGFQTPIPVKVTGNAFAIDIPVSDGGKPGMYEVSVWASVPGASDLVMVSLRTIQVR
jgi:uncharacterized protein YkwD